MKPLKLIAIHKSPEHNCYVFPKQQNFFTFLIKFLDVLEFQECEYDCFIKKWDKKKGEVSKQEESIKKYIDVRQTFERPDFLIEIILGKEKVFLLIHTKKDMQQKFSNLVFKYMNSR